VLQITRICVPPSAVGQKLPLQSHDFPHDPISKNIKKFKSDDSTSMVLIRLDLKYIQGIFLAKYVKGNAKTGLSERLEIL
jgi:hypothetical protein